MGNPIFVIELLAEMYKVPFTTMDVSDRNMDENFDAGFPQRLAAALNEAAHSTKNMLIINLDRSGVLEPTAPPAAYNNAFTLALNQLPVTLGNHQLASIICFNKNIKHFTCMFRCPHPQGPGAWFKFDNLSSSNWTAPFAMTPSALEQACVLVYLQ